MLFDYIRMIVDTGSLSDKSIINQEEGATVALNLTSTQYVYLAQKMPFNNIFYRMDTANSNAATLDIEYFDGTAWRNAVDILDGTSVAGATLGRSGNISFSIDTDYGWQMISDSGDNYAPTEIQTLRIYDCYWLRIRPSANLSAGTKSKELGYAFTATQELNNYDVEINNFMSSFATGKVDWIDEILTASKLMVLDLRRLGLIVHPGQIIQLDDVNAACSLKALELIYFNLGPAYKDKLDQVRKAYSDSLNLRRFTFDVNGDGKIDQAEQTNVIRKLVR